MSTSDSLRIERTTTHDERLISRIGPRDLGASLRRQRQRIVVAAILLTFSIALAIVVWPGRMSNDTLSQIEQVRSGEYNDWHAPLLLLLWRPFWILGFGPGWVMWIALLTFVVGLYGILRVRLARSGAVIVTMAITLMPAVVGYVIYLGRDMWFAALFMATSGALVASVRYFGRARVVAMVCVGCGVWLMQAARQNALPACLVLVLAATLAWTSQSPNASSRRRRVGQALGVTALAGIAILGSQALLRRVFDVQSTHPEQVLYIYDIAAISHAEREMLFGPEIYPTQDLADLDVRFDISMMHRYVFSDDPAIPYPVPGDLIDELRGDWVDAISGHPRAYLDERLTLWLAVIGVTQPSSWVVHPVIDPNPWGYVPANPGLDAWLQDYIRLFAKNDSLEGGILHAVWLYLLVLVAGLAYLRSQRPDYRALGWICLSCLAYQVSLFIGLMGVGYRLNFHCVAVALAVSAVASADLLARVRRRGAVARLVDAGPAVELAPSGATIM